MITTLKDLFSCLLTRPLRDHLWSVHTMVIFRAVQIPLVMCPGFGFHWQWFSYTATNQTNFTTLSKMTLQITND